MKNIQNNNGKNKKNKKQTSSDPWARSGERPGRGHGSDLFVFFGFSMVFCSLAKTSRTQKKKSDPWARSGLSTHKPKNQKNKKPRNQKTKKTKNQKNKKPKNQKTKKTKKNKKTRPNTLHLTPSPWGVQSCFFLFLGFWVFWFFGFLVFWFFGFLVCVWIAQTLPMGLNFFFFCVLEVLAKLQKTMEKPKKQKTKKTQDCTPQGEGVRCRVLGLVFLFFLFFLVFCFFGFLVFWFG